MSRLYLSDRGRYRVRYLDATVRIAQWDDRACVFVTGRGTQRRTLPMDLVAAVSPFEVKGRCVIRFVPLDECYRDRHKPKDRHTRAWQHPYAGVRSYYDIRPGSDTLPGVTLRGTGL